MADPDVDMEELEARLYGQVHHGANEDEEPSSYRPPAAGAEPPGRRFDRYFEKTTPQAPFPSGNIQYQSPLNLNPNASFFQSNHNLFNTPANFYKNFRLVPLSDLVLNPAVNNIVVFPPPPTQIFTQQNPPEWKMAKRMQNMMNKKERYLKRRREKRKRKKLEKKNKFREHYMMQPPQRTGLLESNSNEIENKMSERSDEVICLSESNSSDCEAIHSDKDESVVILSSDDESKICDQSVVEVKCENSSANVKVNINNDTKPQRAIETCIDNNKRSKPEPSDVASTEDDEVIFVEPAGRQEVIIIDCEDSQMFPVKKTTVVSRETIIQERRELLDTPESTNDFLDSTLTLNKNNEDDLNTTEQRADLDTCETESSCSTNDCETPSRSAIFNEGVFDSPSKGLSELNFESFTNYIATKAMPNRIPSILTPIKSAAALRADKSNNSRANSSDSSSESDYEDSKSAYVDKRKRVNNHMEKKPSESAQNKKDALPNLSTITSEVELNLINLTNDKSKFPQKKEKMSKSSRNKKAPLANLSIITSDEELDLTSDKSPQKKEKKSKSSRNKKAPLPNLSPITSDEELDITDLTNGKSKSSQKKEKTSKSNRNKKAPLPNLSPITSDEELDITDSKSSQKKQKTSKSSPSQQSVEQPVKQVRAEKRKSDTRKSPEPSKKPRENLKADLIQQETMEGSDSESSEDSDSMERPEPSKKSLQNKEKPSADSMQTIEDSDPMKSPELSKKPQQNVDNSPPNLIQRETVEELDFETSESDSDVEIVPPSNLDSRGSDLELLNIEAGSSSISVPQEKPNTKLKRFSDYWTDDMKKFYFETWNDENFSVEEEQRKMTDDPKFWKIIARDWVNVNMQPKGPRCHRCREFGHKSHNCKKKIGPPKCILCGARGHLEARCPNKVCTSCGRRSQYSTTYCSRCANSRYAWCKICLVRGHTSSYCTDLWRRYHLTTRNGPVIQPISTRMKASKDQWCSGCACRGHFEHSCNYYNRTHPPTNPFIHSYNDVHDSINASRGLEWQKTDNRGIAPQEVTDGHDEKHGSDEFLPLDSFYATQTRRGGGENYLNNIKPLIPTPINLSSLQIYPYNQAFAPNVLQSNFYQQYPLGHQFVPSNTTSDSSPAHNAETMISHAEAIVEDFGVASNNSDQQSQNLNKCNIVEVWRTKKYASKLLQGDGAQFLKVLRKQSNVKITVGKQKWNNGLRYVCMFEGQDDQIPQANDAIDRYLSILYDKGSMKKKCSFFKKINKLKENIQLLENPLRPWIRMANSVYDRLKSIENNMNIEKNPKRKLQLESKVKRQYTILNAMILGKLKIADGPKHMSILKQWTTEGDKKTVAKSYGSVYHSFIYIFKNESHLNINYKEVIKTFCNDKRLKIKIETKIMFDSGISLCQMQNWTNALNGHKDLFNLVIINNYSDESFRKFKNNFKSSIEFVKKLKKTKKSNKHKKKLSSVS